MKELFSSILVGCNKRHIYLMEIIFETQEEIIFNQFWLDAIKGVST